MWLFSLYTSVSALCVEYRAEKYNDIVSTSREAEWKMSLSCIIVQHLFDIHPSSPEKCANRKWSSVHQEICCRVMIVLHSCWFSELKWFDFSTLHKKLSKYDKTQSMSELIGFCMVAHRAAAHCLASYFQNEIFSILLVTFNLKYYNTILLRRIINDLLHFLVKLQQKIACPNNLYRKKKKKS